MNIKALLKRKQTGFNFIPNDDYFMGEPICDMARVCTDINKNRVIYTDKDKFHIGNPYFKYYNSKSYDSADKMTRISFLRPEYIPPHQTPDGKQGDWVLNRKERKTLVDMLRADSKEKYADGNRYFTNWELAIIRFNNENGLMSTDETTSYVCDEKDFENIVDILPFNLPMPDYMLLDGESMKK